MGVLRVQAVSRRAAGDAEAQVVLPARCVIGRSPGSDLVITNRSVSGQHAAIEWTGAEWQLRDLGSRNGTIVDNRRLSAGARAALVAGSRLQFGADATIYVLGDASAPQLMAQHMVTREFRVADGGYLVLPELAAPAWSVYQDVHGTWLAERDGETSTIEDRAILAVGADLWRVHLPASVVGVWQDPGDALLLERMRLRFRVTRDEEHVEVVAECGEARWDLQARAHHYPLLVLARRRLADRAAGVDAAEEGWIGQDELARMLRMDDNNLDVSIHRARAQLGKLGVPGAASLVERRTGSRQLRLGVADVEVAAIAG